jgi:hypothetical protein
LEAVVSILRVWSFIFTPLVALVGLVYWAAKDE